MLNGELSLNYNHLLVHAIGAEQGLPEDALGSLSEAFAQVHPALWEKTGKGSDFLGFLDLPQDISSQLDQIQAVADDLAAQSDIHVVLGIGGSYLGAKALIQALCHPYHNELSRSKRKHRPRIYFEGNSLDTDSLNALRSLLPEGVPADLSEHWSLNVISKSGGTIETAVAFRFLRHWLEASYGAEAAQRIVATTDVAKGQLKALANKEGYRTFVIPDNVGGRYSVLTPVGLLPAAVAGINIHEVVRGAQDMAELCKNPNPSQNPAYAYAGLQYLSASAGRDVSVMNIWDKSLESIGFWYDQLCAESLGKEGRGRVPLTGVCTRDLHARGQQLQQGERNTLVTNLFVSKPQAELVLPSDTADSDALNYLGAMPIQQMLSSAFEGTNFAYLQDQRPTLDLVLGQRSAYHIGALFYLLEVATVAEGYLMQINPLDQPGVEAYKQFMFGLLGRSDMARYKDLFEARLPDRDAAIL